MSDLSKYWRFFGVVPPGGGYKLQELEDAKVFVNSRFSHEKDLIVWRKLTDLRLNGDEESKRLADICLRCFISHQIRKICINLESKYGKITGFTREDLFSVLLDDNLTVKSGSYESKALMVLRTFDPNKARLSTWTWTVVGRCQDVKDFLLEYGIYDKLSPWRLLIDSKVNNLPFIFSGGNAVEEYQLILKAYHDVYRRQRLQQNKRGKYENPTQQQLEEMVNLLPQELKLSPDKLEKKLENLASMVREYRATKKGCLPKEQPKQHRFDDSENQTNWLDKIADIDTENSNEIGSKYCNIEMGREFLKGYILGREVLQAYSYKFYFGLEKAIEKAIDDSIKRLKKAKRRRNGKKPQPQDFLTALELYYNHNISMGEIAQKLSNYETQEGISRLLELKDFRASVKKSMLLELKKEVEEIGSSLTCLNNLKAIGKQIDEFLDQEISEVLEEDKKECSGRTPPERRSLIAVAIRKYFDKKRRQ